MVRFRYVSNRYKSHKPKISQVLSSYVSFFFFFFLRGGSRLSFVAVKLAKNLMSIIILHENEPHQKMQNFIFDKRFHLIPPKSKYKKQISNNICNFRPCELTQNIPLQFRGNKLKFPFYINYCKLSTLE